MKISVTDAEGQLTELVRREPKGRSEDGMRCIVRRTINGRALR